MFWYIVLATIPGGIIGFLLDHFLEDALTKPIEKQAKNSNLIAFRMCRHLTHSRNHMLDISQRTRCQPRVEVHIRQR